ncbi:hypothetical protein [Alkalilimnicola sp. S0819]|uniref:hypothetical protein n=1 Tax=Alkalilimnicola sp. S0819 TaxID=2613922 RepID=UPI001261B0FD|nr:hypothetical protein [Alkalilimnicola sp. S0819]KAB7627769.1 hypothetical protein F3N43_01965 [Alkalilimnicola sp. S0819]MPQ15393.1 hypothetical protein [Alkalilimnicola sp. S0819]
MKKLHRLFAAAALLAVTAPALANGTAPRIQNACVTFPNAEVARITGMVFDAEWNAQAVAPLPLGVCENAMPNVQGVSYVCDVPAAVKGATLTLVAADSDYNFSAPVEVKIEYGCTYF